LGRCAGARYVVRSRAQYDADEIGDGGKEKYDREHGEHSRQQPRDNRH
jgi:hypothetical protein